jgi:hypothetical protein
LTRSFLSGNRDNRGSQNHCNHKHAGHRCRSSFIDSCARLAIGSFNRLHPSRRLSVSLDEAASTGRAQARAHLFGAVATVCADSDPIPGDASPELCFDDERLVISQNGCIPLLQLIISGERVGLR